MSLAFMSISVRARQLSQKEMAQHMAEFDQAGPCLQTLSFGSVAFPSWRKTVFLGATAIGAATLLVMAMNQFHSSGKHFDDTLGFGNSVERSFTPVWTKETDDRHDWLAEPAEPERSASAPIANIEEQADKNTEATTETSTDTSAAASPVTSAICEDKNEVLSTEKNIEPGNPEYIVDNALTDSNEITTIPAATSFVTSLSDEPFVLPEFNFDRLEPTESYLERLKNKEKLRLQSYLDNGPGSTWTIGYGHTGRMPDGTPVLAGKSITQTQADALFRLDVKNHGDRVKQMLAGIPLTQSQYHSLLDFSYNKGAGKLETFGFIKHLSEGQYLNAADEFLRWTGVVKRSPDGQVIKDDKGRDTYIQLPGLVERASTNRELMREGFSPRLIEILEASRDQAESASITAARALRFIEPLQITPVHDNTGSNIEKLERAAQRIESYVAPLERRIEVLVTTIEDLRAERISMIETIKQHPGLLNPHVSQQQADHAIEMINLTRVIEFIEDSRRAQIDRDTLAREHFRAEMLLLNNAALALKAGTGTNYTRFEESHANHTGNIQVLVENVNELLLDNYVSRDIATSMPSQSKSVFNSSTAKTLAALLQRADQAIEQPRTSYGATLAPSEYKNRAN